MKQTYLTPLLCLGLVCSSALMASCDDYLDTMPDNRAEVDNIEKIQQLLTSAYSTTDYILLNEMVSDNVDDHGPSNPYTDLFVDQVYAWQDVTENDNESPENIWDSGFNAIAHANLVLEAIERLGGAKSDTLQKAKAEALLCRAFAHFVLVNTFCKSYNSQTSATDLGLPYIVQTESKLNPQYERGNVADDYAMMERDILEALPMVGDAYLKVPKYHFNQKAAYAFAARFFLFYEKWDEAVRYATLCLGTAPGTMLRDWQYMSTLPQSSPDPTTLQYIDATQNCNLLMLTAYSNIGLTFGAYYINSRYNHGAYLASNEDANAQNIWGGGSLIHNRIKVYAGTNLDKCIFWKLPYLFEYTDPVAQIGYRRTVYPALTADECLLNRAEAYVMLGQYDEAAQDLTLWMQNFTTSRQTLTPQYVQSFYAPIGYSYEPSDDDPQGLLSTIKKHLHPAFHIDEEGSVQESMLQCVLGFRRIETLQTGLRWWDVKRYGIEIVRRQLDAKNAPLRLTDRLPADDERRAIQIPLKVRNAGLQPNPRD